MKTVTAEAPKKMSPGETVLAKRLHAYRRGDIDPVQQGEDGAGFDGHVPYRIAGSFRGGATSKNLNSAPFEHLDAFKFLTTESESKEVLEIRYDVSCRVRRLYEDSRMIGLRSPNMSSVGGGGYREHEISDRKAASIIEMTRFLERMPSREARLLETVLVFDQWIWFGHTRKRKAQILEDIRKAIDRAAVYYGRVSEQEFTSRWRALRGAHRRRARSAV
jgi:hypothetical protein